MPTPDASQYTFIHKLQVAQECEKNIAPEKLRIARQYFTRPIGIDTLFGENALKSNKYLADLILVFGALVVWIVSTIAGSSSPGINNGSGTSAQFYFPNGVAVDILGNVYVADSGNNIIRKITPEGVVSTLAGDGTPEHLDGTGTSARFNAPQGVAVDSLRNVYVADSYNHRIRKITPAGLVSTLAGDGTAAYLDATGTSAEFNYPYGVAVDSLGNVYVADSSNHSIRKINPAGLVSTLAGDGTAGYLDQTATSAQFYFPNGVAVDSLGNVYVADNSNHSIRKITYS